MTTRAELGGTNEDAGSVVPNAEEISREPWTTSWECSSWVWGTGVSTELTDSGGLIGADGSTGGADAGTDAGAGMGAELDAEEEELGDEDEELDDDDSVDGASAGTEGPLDVSELKVWVAESA